MHPACVIFSTILLNVTSALNILGCLRPLWRGFDCLSIVTRLVYFVMGEAGQFKGFGLSYGFFSFFLFFSPLPPLHPYIVVFVGDLGGGGFSLRQSHETPSLLSRKDKPFKIIMTTSAVRFVN